MPQTASNISRNAVSLGLCVACLALLPAVARSQTTQPGQPESLLIELNRETQSLFKQISPSIVRVELPMPTNVSLSPDDPLSKWASRLDPESRARLLDQERRSQGTSFVTAEIRPGAGPTTAPTASEPTQQIIVFRLDRFSPNGIGIVLDDQSHILIPRYVDKDACQAPIPVAIGDGRWGTASFVASDRQADLTLLQLNNIKAKPATVSPAGPDAGTLLLVMSLSPAANRLAVWEGWEPDVSTIVNIDGTIAGFTKNGRFLAAAACAPVVQELLDHGYVRRVILGVGIEMVGPDDPQRRSDPSLGATPAIRIEQVAPDSIALRAGLQPNDLILSLAGHSVGTLPAFAAAIANRRGPTDLQILRNSQRRTIQINLQVQ